MRKNQPVYCFFPVFRLTHLLCGDILFSGIFYEAPWFDGRKSSCQAVTREYTKDILRRICLCVEDDMQRAAYDLFIMYKGGRILILCFGTLGKVLRECKLDAVSDVLLIGTLTQTVDPTSLYGESDGSTVSRLLSCAQNLSNGQKRRMGRKCGDIGY